MRTFYLRILLGLLLFTALLIPPSEADGQWFLFGRTKSRYKRCVELYEAKQYPEASRCIKDFLGSYPKSRFAEHLVFLDAKMETNVNEAQSKFLSFLTEFPEGPYSAEANFQLGEIYELRGDIVDAGRCYFRIYLRFADSEFRDEAGLRAAKCMLINGDTMSARKHLEVYLADHQTNPWKDRAKELYADALYREGDYARAQEEYRDIISGNSSESSCPRCYLRIAEIYEIMGNHAGAFQSYRRFLEVFPNSFQREGIEQKLAALAAILNIDLSAENRMQVVEAGTFESEPEAVGLVMRLKKLGYQAYVVTRNTPAGDIYSVRLGPYESRDSVLAVKERLKSEAGLDVTLLPGSASPERKDPE